MILTEIVLKMCCIQFVVTNHTLLETDECPDDADRTLVDVAPDTKSTNSK
jgi:hypothetical protein